MTFKLSKEESQYINIRLSQQIKSFSIQKFFPTLNQESDKDEETASFNPEDKERIQLIQRYKMLKSKLGKKSEAHKLQARKLQQIKSKGISEQNENFIELMNLQKNKSTKKGLKKLSKIINELSKDRNENLYFLYDVNYIKLRLPSYKKLVSNPMSLQKISQRVQNHYYQEFQQAQMDLNTIVKNSLLFNSESKQMNKITQKFQKNYLKTMLTRLQKKKYFDVDKIYEQIDFEQQIYKLKQQKAQQIVSQQDINDSVFEDYPSKSESHKSNKSKNKTNKTKRDQNSNKSKKKTQNKKEKQKIYGEKDIKDIILRVNSIFKDVSHPKRKQFIQFIRQTMKSSEIDLKNATYDQVKLIQQKLIEIQKENPKPKQPVEEPKTQTKKRNIRLSRNMESQNSEIISQSDT